MIRTFFFILSILLFIDTGYAIVLIERTYEPIKGIQVFNLNFPHSELDNFLVNVKNSGFDTVFLRVFHNENDRYHYGETSMCKSGVYFKTSKICMVNNILEEFIVKAHSYKLKVFAWMATRSLSALKDIYGVDETFTINGIKRNGYGVNLFNERVFSDVERLFRDLSNYNIDGVLIQDDFILKYDESASTEAKQKFYVDTGILLSNNNISKDVADMFAVWKTKQLQYYLSKIIWGVKYINPSIKIALNIYYETPLYTKNALKWYSQSIEDFKNTGVDYFAFMAYHKQIADENNITFFDVASLINNGLKKLVDVIEPNSRVIAKFQIKNFHDKEYIDYYEFERLCSIANGYGDIGIVVLPVESNADLQFTCGSARREK